MASSMDNGLVMRVFSKISYSIGRFGLMDRINCGVFKVFPVEHFILV